MRHVVVVVLGLVACSSPSADPEPRVNPLDAIDPAQGFVADSRAATGGSLADGTRAQVASRDRILFVGDPLGVARLAAEIERERTYCKTPPCPLDVKIEAAVTSYAQKPGSYTPILVAHHQSLARWAALAAAHQALGIANVLDQAGTLTDTGRAEIQDAASMLSGSLAAVTYATLDWGTDPAAMAADPTIGSELLGHAPVIVPLPATEAAAIATVTAVLAEVDRQTDPTGTGTVTPLSIVCCAKDVAPPVFGSPAYQVVRRLALLREWAALPEPDLAIGGYTSALTELAQKTLAGAAADVTWSMFRAGSTPYAVDVATLQTVIDAAAIVENPGFASVPDPNMDQYFDRYASDLRANTVTASAALLGPGWQLMRPAVTLRTSLWIPHARPGEIYERDHLETAELSGTLASDGASEAQLAGPIAVEWDVQTSAPLDHLDVRIYSGADPVPFLHYLERPSAGLIPTRTMFNPVTMDPHAEMLPIGMSVITYYVYVIAVDVRGRASFSTRSSITVLFPALQPETVDEVLAPWTMPREEELRVGQLWNSGSDPSGLPAEQVTLRPYADSMGSYVRFQPTVVRIGSATGSLTVFNADSSAHRLRSMYTPPEQVDPSLVSLAIGGVEPLDLGVVEPGDTVVIPLPAGAVNYTEWTLFEVDGVAPNRQQLVVQVRP